MLKVLGALLAAIVIAFIAFMQWRRADRHADEAAWRELAVTKPATVNRFDPAMIAGLPDAARRCLDFAIAPGTPLAPVVRLQMQGQLGLGDKTNPKYRSFQARQIIAFPHGFVWRLDAGAIGGSDGLLPTGSWTRFWLLGLVVRVASDDHHRRSAFGRLVAEAAFWAPASLLPGPHVRWEEAGRDTARAVVTYNDLDQAVEIEVAPDGQPRSVMIQRWSSENADSTYRLQPFGGYLPEYRDFGGYRLPTRVEGGNHFGQDAYFPFFKAKITEVDIGARE
ncbi:MAG: hypothetical protein JJ937_14520 [Parvibaculum sp.]|uniref:DUF6544 family protein n=1 Tax=Alphaproteobacteria TaxID=28211 RepID=UPI001B1F7398|nr:MULTISPECIES: DUF6544 family protein [Alphaproteobacteria]MBO6635743.1 hypothetical protein [Parvibaculum sp.]